ncbi:MAG: EscU/YscU/HrcU family type III secretion system export apparatus switch protein [Planctomycetota bacterium]
MSDRKETPPAVVALRHDREDDARAPEVVAKGTGEIAERILDAAAQAGVPIRRDADLVELLSIVEVGDEIPVEVYGVVAELVAFLWALNEERRDARA